MELIEFAVFLTMMLIMLMLSFVKKGILFSVLGIVITLFVMPFAAFPNTLILSRTYIMCSNGTLTQQDVYASSTLMVLIFTMLFIMFFMSAVLSVKRGETE
jgi:hypothetical protein